VRSASLRAPLPLTPAAGTLVILQYVSGPAASAPEASESASAPPSEDGGAFRIRALDRAVLLLKAVAASATAPTVLELARACGINRSIAWRLLRSLEYHGLIGRDPVTQRYTVGYGAIAIAAAVTDDTLVRRIRPLLKDLSARTAESVTLAVANAAACDLGGKVFLAWLGPDERDAILPEELPGYTPRTITRRGQLERELEVVRRARYALCAPEYEEFLSGASAAVLNSRGYPMAVVNVWGPTPRNPVRKLHKMGREAVKTAEEIAKQDELLRGFGPGAADRPRPPMVRTGLDRGPRIRHGPAADPGRPGTGRQPAGSDRPAGRAEPAAAPVRRTRS
jgi:DNA-binding IclR family transcriptional regulator